MLNYKQIWLTEKSEVGIIDDTYIVKIRLRGKLDHEYHVGLKLNELESPHFVRTLSLIHHPTIPDKDVLYLSKAPGTSLINLFKDISSGQELKNYLLFVHHLILIVSDAACRIGFNHNDLYRGNIMVLKSSQKEYKYQTHIGEKIIISPFNITLIDYEFSHINDVNNEWISIGQSHILLGLIPSVGDDFGDLFFLTLRYLINTNITDKFNDLAKLYLCGQSAINGLDFVLGKDVIISHQNPILYLSSNYTEHIQLNQLISYTYTQLGARYNLIPSQYSLINQAAMSDPEITEFKTRIRMIFGSVVAKLKYDIIQTRSDATRKIMLSLDDFFSN